MVPRAGTESSRFDGLGPIDDARTDGVGRTLGLQEGAAGGLHAQGTRETVTKQSRRSEVTSG